MIWHSLESSCVTHHSHSLILYDMPVGEQEELDVSCPGRYDQANRVAARAIMAVLCPGSMKQTTSLMVGVWQQTWSFRGSLVVM